MRIRLRENNVKNIEIERLSKKFNISYDITKYLLLSGYDENKINLLSYSDYIDINDVNITNMDIAAEKLIKFLFSGPGEIFIRGDYDSDGMNSSYIAKSILDNIIDVLELETHVTIIDVDRADKYGINKKDCLKIIKSKGINKICLILDNGITKSSCTNLLNKYKIDSIIIDHHVPREEKDIPKKGSIVIDPHYNDVDNEDGKGLCAAALTFFFFKKVLELLEDDSDFINLYRANAAIATITDCMPITNLNIALVNNGLKDINSKNSTLSINYYKKYKKDTIIYPREIAFELGPQLNACGRMHNVKLAIDYLLEENELEIANKYSKILKTNEDRKKLETDAINNISINNSDNVTMAILDKKNDGIIGSVASKLLEKYNKTTILFVEEDSENLIGSARSNDINLHELFKNKNIEKYIESFGGHAQAAGIFIKKDNFEKLKDELNKELKDTISTDINNEIIVDEFVSLDYINNKNLFEYKKVMFFNDLKEPLLCIPNVNVYSTRTSSNPENICFNFYDNSVKLKKIKKKVKNKDVEVMIGKEIWAWKFASKYANMGSPKKVHIIGKLSTMFGSPTIDIVDIIDSNIIESY